MKALFDFIDAHASQYVSDLQHLLRQPSVSAHNLGVKETAAMVQRFFAEAGGRAHLVNMPGAQPVVYAEFDGESGPTLAFYNHYDVQPPDPLELWRSHPFAAEIRDGRIWARGAGDNKGNLMARIAAVKAYREVHGRLPLPVKFIVEGEEEIGSPHLGQFAEAHPDLVRAAACVWEGGFKDSTGRPVIYCGVKGILLRGDPRQRRPFRSALHVGIDCPEPDVAVDVGVGSVEDTRRANPDPGLL